MITRTDRDCRRCHGTGDEAADRLCTECLGQGTVCRDHGSPDCRVCHDPQFQL